jgi:hypothetical protein
MRPSNDWQVRYWRRRPFSERASVKQRRGRALHTVDCFSFATRADAEQFAADLRQRYGDDLIMSLIAPRTVTSPHRSPEGGADA